MATRLNPLPNFANLPLNDDDPPYSAWGLWSDPKSASLGSLNYLTNEIVYKTLREEVKTGERVGLEYCSAKFSIRGRPLTMFSLPLDFFKPPLLGRAPFEQKVIDKSPFVINDDVVSHRSMCSAHTSQRY